MLHRPRRVRAFLASALALACVTATVEATAQDAVEILDVRLDRSTHHVVGVQVLIAGDDDGDASATVRVRELGGGYRDAPSLLRVRPDTVTLPIELQLAGSIFDLAPGTEHEVEITVADPDGGGGVRTVAASTRALPPSEPASPRLVPVTSAGELASALSAAQPGDVIEIADGTYSGAFSMLASGTPDAPIVIRGQSQDGVVLDGGNCDCNIVEVYGSHVIVERMTMRAAVRALRFQGEGATSNVARYLKIRDVVHGIASRVDQTDFAICDNDIEGRLAWPWTFADDATSHWDDRGVEVTGDGHVVCHNRIVGFGDPVVNKKNQSRAWDVYGNDIRASYDGTELDDAQGNVRLYGNRFVDVMNPVSIQPVRGGPAYVLRNVGFNIPEEQIKLKSLGGTDLPSGAVIAHNTFVSPKIALNLQTPITQFNFVVRNNLFVGPETLAGSRTVDWTASLDGGSFDFDGYYPDGGLWFGRVDGQDQVWSSWAELQAAGAVEPNGVLLERPIFEGDVVGPTDEQSSHEPPSFALAETSNAVDAGLVIPGVNDRAPGGPDLGAWERGCPTPFYGPRDPANAGVTNRIDCGANDASGGGGGSGGGSGSGSGSGGDGFGTAGAGGPGGTGGPAGPSGAGGSSGVGQPTDAVAGAGGGDSAAGGDDDGCGCAVPGGGERPAAWAGVALALGALVAFRLGRRRLMPNN